MAETHDTIDGLLAEFRGYAFGMQPSYHVTMSWADFRVMLNRFEAAHKREIEATAAKCCQLGRLAGYGESEIKHQQDPVGNEAKYGEDRHKPVLKRKPRLPIWAGVEYHYAMCSKCGGYVHTGFETTAQAVAGWPSLYPFCPHCGALMQSSEYDGRGAKLYRRGREALKGDI